MRIHIIWSISLIIASFGLFSPNPMEFIASILTIPLLCTLFLQYEGFSVILLGFLMQWLSVSIKLFYGYFYTLPLEEVLPKDTSPSHIHDAFWLSLVGIWIFAIGFYAATSRCRRARLFQTLENNLLAYSPRKIVLFAIAFHFAYTVLFVFRFSLPGLNSILTVMNQLKWGFFLIAFYITHKHNSEKKLFYLYAAFLFVTGFGFFSDFKEVLFFMLIGVISVKPQIGFKQYLIVTLAILAIVRIGLVWTAVKGDYRYFLSGGQRTIVNVRTQSEALSYLWELVSNLQNEDIKDATDDLVSRIGYIDYFSLTLRHVPDRVAHQGGDIWQDAFTHIFMPRMFFPNKPPIDDSAHTTRYTGRYFSGLGTASFSLGYTADAYIDFGRYFMFFPIFLLGWLMGKIFEFILLKSSNIMWGIIFTTPFYFFTNVYGMNTIKVVGLFFAYIIFIFLTKKYIVRFIDPLLKNDSIAPSTIPTSYDA